MNYYNEHNPFAVMWSQNLINASVIPRGIIDYRGIENARASELHRFTQCHFFSGIGGWSEALRLAGWPETERVWTGSCPCQPFSQAGKGAGFDDERHLWPVWFRLIQECQPPVIFGEQVASKKSLPWLDNVQVDLEAEGYAFGVFDLCAAGFGSPHLRQRLYFVAEKLDHAPGEGSQVDQAPRPGERGELGRASASGSLAKPHSWQRDGGSIPEAWNHGYRGDTGREEGNGGVARGSEAGSLVDSSCEQHGRPRDFRQTRGPEHPDCGNLSNLAHPNSPGLATRGDATPTPGHGDPLGSAGCDAGHRDPGPTNGFWGAADWVRCTDGKWRASESGIQPLAHGVPNRVGALSGAGNAIVPEVAAEVILAYTDFRKQEV